MNIDFTTQIWREGDTYVAFSPELEVSSCGASVQEARKNLLEAVEGFVEAAKAQGTLQEILEEAGYTEEDAKRWKAPDLLALERMQMAI